MLLISFVFLSLTNQLMIGTPEMSNSEQGVAATVRVSYTCISCCLHLDISGYLIPSDNGYFLK